MLCLTLVLWFAGASTALAARLPDHLHKGFVFTSWWNDAYESPKAADSLAQMKATHPNSVAFIVTWYTHDLKSNMIYRHPDSTPSDHSMREIVARAKSMGLRTFLRPVVDSYSGGWRGVYQPADPQAWFADYRRFIFHYAELAESMDVDLFSVGMEYKSMTIPAYSRKWRSIIAGVRKRFTGKLTYGGVMGDRVNWWAALDYVGVDWYMQLARPGESTSLSVRELLARWSRFTDEYHIRHNYLRELARLSARWRKPIIFNEVGFPSRREGLFAPFNATVGPANVEVQARAFRAMFRALRGRKWLKGLYVWEWFYDDARFGPGDPSHSPQNKLAEATLRTWFR